MGVNVAKNLILAGSLPFAFANSRILAILGFRTIGECEDTNIASAWVAANSEPAEEVPA